jgi:hypothetical protein
MTKAEHREYWFDIIEQQRASGQTVKDFVQARQLSYAAFFRQLKYYRKLGLDSAIKPSPS